MSAVVIDGGIVHYEAFGRGMPVLFLHGWLGSWRYWMSTMEAISDKHRAFAIDLWGFGDSDKSKDRYRIEDYVDLINKFIENRGMTDTPITLIGHALGAAVMLKYATDFPERVQKMMVVSPPLNTGTINYKLLDPSSNNSVMSKMMRWRQQIIPHKEVQSEAEKTGQGAISSSLASVKALELEMDIPSRIQTVAQQGTMVLAVYGEKDDVIDPALTRGLDGRWQNIRPIGLAESKHFPMLDEATKFQRLLKDFLEVKDDLSVLELKEEWRRRTR
ncbi:MAG: alpha/beta hydrolase [Anaerolineae bacterium]|nr:alpha/beta hydrolase [Anaerolineae bacterium]